jgi:ADP-heptose:LPS heptosyltransferase
MKKILVIRNDRLGDLMLILPALRIIKSSIPNIEIDCLANENYKDLSLLSCDIDNIISESNLYKSISKQSYDYSISFFSTFNIAYKLWRSNIKRRYAPATKLAQLLYNRTIKQDRSKSLKPEYEYNIDLSCYFLKDNGYEINKIDAPLIRLISQNELKDNSKKNIFIHPFTGGSSKTLSDNDFIKLCLELHKLCSCRFILHCDKYDYEKCLNIKNKVANLDMDIIKPTDQLIQMFSNINECDLFISGSTGPLHVAGSLNKKTVGFYPSKKSSTSLRWRTVNEESNKLSFEDSETDDKYIKVDINSVADEIYNKLLK